MVSRIQQGVFSHSSFWELDVRCKTRVVHVVWVVPESWFYHTLLHCLGFGGVMGNIHHLGDVISFVEYYYSYTFVLFRYN